MNAAEITPKAIFSLRHQVKQNAHYISDFQILYPAGSVLVMHNYVEKRQRYIKLFEKSTFLELIIISPSRKYAAIIENSEKGQIIIFDMNTLKKKRVLNLPHDSLTTRFETLSFTHDDLYIVAITGDPDYNMLVYNWMRGKVSSNTKAIPPGSTATVVQVCCSPVSSNNICLLGRGLFRLLTLSETVWKQYGFSKVDQLNITTGAWLNGETLICGTGDGKIFFVENGEIKGVFNAFTALTLSVRDKDEYFQQMASSSLLAIKTVSKELEGQDLTVRTIITFTKGFAYSCGTGYVHIFEKDKNKYKKRNVFVIDDPIVEDLHSADINVVKHLSINVSQDKLLATTNRAQLYMVRLWGPDLNVAPRIPFRHLGEPLHNGSINGLSLCIWKPIFATSGKFDRTIQIWNFESESVQIVKHFDVDVRCMDIHPTGTFIAIGFADHIEFSLILMNDIQSGRSIPFKNCSLCTYSFLGNYIAAITGNVVEIYNTVMYNNVYTLKGHQSNINRLRWTSNNKKIATCGDDGFILLWDTINGELCGEIQNPGVRYLDIALSHDGKFIYAVGDDGFILEIADNNIVKKIGVSQNVISSLAVSKSNLLMFISSGTSDVMSVKMPLTNPPDLKLYPFHATKITQIRITFDDLTLITVSDGGSIILWKLNWTEEKTTAVDKTFIYSNEVLINKDQLQQHIMMMKDLSQKLYEMEMGQAREMRDTENSYNETMKEMHDNFTSVIEDLKEKIEETETNQRNQLINMRKEIDKLKQDQENEKKTMIENYQAKLLVEYDKVYRLDLLKEETLKNFGEMVSDLIRTKEEETNEIVNVYDQKLLSVKNDLQQCHESNLRNIESHEITKQYLEDDADRELVETKANYEKILKEENELNVSFKGQVARMRKKYTEAHKNRVEFRFKLESLMEEQQKLQTTVQTHEKDIADLKAEIIERDLALKEKDERILLLKKKIQEMQKYKFVLDYKIKELKNQIDPKDREIREKKEEIIDMEMELENLKRMNSSLELQVTELKEKINGTDKEVTNYERMHKSSVIALKQIKIDVYALYHDLGDFKKLKDGIICLLENSVIAKTYKKIIMKLIEQILSLVCSRPPKLPEVRKRARIRLYHKYNEENLEVAKEQFGDTDAQRDFVLQREFLEKTILALKSTINKNQRNKANKRKVLQDNQILLEELNVIRKELKETITAVRNLDRIIGMGNKRGMAPSEAYNKIIQTLKKQDEIKEVYKKVIMESEIDTVKLNAQIKIQEEKLANLLYSDVEV